MDKGNKSTVSVRKPLPLQLYLKTEVLFQIVFVVFCKEELLNHYSHCHHS